MQRFLFQIIFLLLFIIPNTAHAIQIYDNQEMDSGYITVIDENGDMVLQTGLNIHAGDEYISENNVLYEITMIESSLARARVIQTEALNTAEPLTITTQTQSSSEKPLIAIYHTHTDEAYIPTDGKSAIPGNGSIMLVGDAFTNALTNLGYQVEHNKTLHEPHDANAYQRSRRTFMNLLTHNPVALFDVHRDSAPLNIYKTTINGQDAAKILLVVGKQNQNLATTKEYAKNIKSACDNKYKGLIRGIFIAHGNYNQDLNPKAMLIEIGTQYNTLEAAEHSVALFADVVPSFINSNVAAGPTSTASNIIDNYAEPVKDYGQDILFILVTLIIGIIAYLYLSTGSWQEAKKKLYKFYKYEFTNFLGSYKKKN